jgi:protein-glutamine gamma-glutamyltransferase
MKIGTAHRLGLSGALALGAAGVMPGSPILFAAGAALIALMVVRSARLLELDRPRKLALAVHAFTVVALLSAMAIAVRRPSIDAVVLIVVLGVANRYLLRGGHRDDLILAGASGVLIMMATTVTPGIGFFLIIVVYIPIVHIALWASQLLSASELAPPDERRSALMAVASRPAPARFGFLAGSSLALTLLGYTVLIFFPRYRFLGWLGAGAFLNLGAGGDSMELRSGGVPAPTGGEVVARLEPGPRTRSIDLEGLYARMFVFDRFDGRTFSGDKDDYYAGRGPRGPAVVGGQTVTANDPQRVGAARVVLERNSPRGANQAVATFGRQRPTRVGLSVEQSGSGTWWASIPRSAQTLRYAIDLGQPVELARLRDVDQAAANARSLEVPEGVDPQVIALAEQLIAGKTTAEEKVAAILAHFDRGFAYSLDPLEGESDDPLVRFLFEAKKGHCELYAGAVTVLLRIAGVPARVATGYYGGRWNPRGRFVEMTTADAHAWVEVLDEQRGWYWVDATPEALRARRGQATFVWLSDVVSMLEAAWYEQVIDFDENRRRSLLRGFTGEVGDWFGDVAGLGSFEWATAGRSASLPIFAIIPVAALVLLAIARRRRGDRTQRLGLALRRALGADKGDNVTLGQLLERISGERALPARAAVELYQALRFGPADAAPSPRAVEVAIKALKAR